MKCSFFNLAMWDICLQDRLYISHCFQVFSRKFHPLKNFGDKKFIFWLLESVLWLWLLSLLCRQLVLAFPKMPCCFLSFEPLKKYCWCCVYCWCYLVFVFIFPWFGSIRDRHTRKNMHQQNNLFAMISQNVPWRKGSCNSVCTLRSLLNQSANILTLC